MTCHAEEGLYGIPTRVGWPCEPHARAHTHTHTRERAAGLCSTPVRARLSENKEEEKKKLPDDARNASSAQKKSWAARSSTPRSATPSFRYPSHVSRVRPLPLKLGRKAMRLLVRKPLSTAFPGRTNQASTELSTRAAGYGAQM